MSTETITLLGGPCAGQRFQVAIETLARGEALRAFRDTGVKPWRGDLRAADEFDVEILVYIPGPRGYYLWSGDGDSEKAPRTFRGRFARGEDRAHWIDEADLALRRVHGQVLAEGFMALPPSVRHAERPDGSGTDIIVAVPAVALR